MIAKCGNFVRWHWAHKARERCDPWHENETDWHRDWKSHFPEDWREVAHTDATSGEHHFADIKTEYGLVIEFQHSPIKAEELESREAFYENMIWVVDGNRTLDGVSFHGGVSAEPFELSPVTYAFEFWGRGRLLERWQHASAPVFFDFGHSELWRVASYDPDRHFGVAYWIPHWSFVEQCFTRAKIQLVEVGEEDAWRLSRWLVRQG